MLSGPKVSVMWTRMLVAPGGASLSNLEVVPVAVDVQVRKVTEYLGVTDTGDRDLEDVRRPIQEAWGHRASEVVAPSDQPGLARTSAFLDPILWFFAKWGCSHCEAMKQKRPISDVCRLYCRFPSKGAGAP
jgi:hypothetical protein